MAFEGDDIGREVRSEDAVLPRRWVSHYHEDETRLLFFIVAFIIIIAQFTGVSLPLSTIGAALTVVVVVIAAILTNLGKFWIHWIDGAISLLGVLVFGATAIEHYRSGMSLFDFSFAYVEALALLSLVALYFTTRTIRGLLQNQS